MASATAEAPEKISEEERVQMHRTKFFYEIMGLEYDQSIINELVFSNVSPHEARQLKKDGCPVDLIPKILL